MFWVASQMRIKPFTFLWNLYEAQAIGIPHNFEPMRKTEKWAYIKQAKLWTNYFYVSWSFVKQHHKLDYNY